jgi:hypothetical protein
MALKIICAMRPFFGSRPGIESAIRVVRVGLARRPLFLGEAWFIATFGRVRTDNPRMPPTRSDPKERSSLAEALEVQTLEGDRVKGNSAESPVPVSDPLLLCTAPGRMSSWPECPFAKSTYLLALVHTWPPHSLFH